ncbi:hypothetical protein ACWDHW_31555 [Streptomyces melanosporofaciens]|uniref:hypothetical protein n=1 Tax=unclassified Streptomyces TaxID=2593676 RepID=UPI0036CCD729
MSRILIVMSAADTWERTDGSAYPTGYWAEEAAAPHEEFVRAGHTVDFASPGGVLQPLDRHSADPEVASENCAHHVAHAERALRESGPLRKLAEIDIEQYNVRDGNLFTGQNPASSGSMAVDMIAALG